MCRSLGSLFATPVLVMGARLSLSLNKNMVMLLVLSVHLPVKSTSVDLATLQPRETHAASLLSTCHGVTPNRSASIFAVDGVKSTVVTGVGRGVQAVELVEGLVQCVQHLGWCGWFDAGA